MIPGTVMLALADADAFVTEVAVKVTGMSPAGAGVGAVYVVGAPLAVVAGETVPQAEPPQDAVQATPWFAESPVTFATNWLD